MTSRRRVVIRGRVQGVSFRDTLRRRALVEGVAGWVRNNLDGSVEAVLEGDPAAVRRCVELCRRGPRGAYVDSVEIEAEEPEGLRGFEIR